MSQVFAVDGDLLSAEQAVIPVTDEGLVRGDGIFEVIRVYNGVPFALEEHLARLERSGQGIRLPVDGEAVRADVWRVLAAAGGESVDARLRIMLTRGGRRIVMTEPLHETPPVARLMTVRYSPTRVLDGIKSLSYGANMLCSRLAREQGYDEALLVTPHGRVLEAPTSSLFYVLAGELYTPPLEDHILASITRAIVIEVTGARQRATPLEDLLGAEEAFLASTVREVQPICAIDSTELNAPGPISRRVAEEVGARIAERVAAERASTGRVSP
jgi:branched-chain amino acid aminotransferase